MAFWLSGVLVLVCCGPRLFEVSALNPVIEDAETCPIGSHDCCKKLKKAETSEHVSESQPQKSADCCAFKPSKTLSANLQSFQINKAPDRPEAIEKPKLVFAKQVLQAPKFYHPIIRNRGSTFKQNCVFRI